MENIIWFQNLNKPLFAPPDWVFTPVWIILYLMIFASLILFLKSKFYASKKMGLFFFITQLVLNIIWSPIFFGMQKIGLALVILSLIWIFTLLTIIFFFKHSKLASLLLIPYLCWLSFAFYLNFGYFVLN